MPKTPSSRSPDFAPVDPQRRRLLSGLALAGLLPLAGCFRPLYGTGLGAGDARVVELLRAIDVDAAGDRTSQVFRNELLFLLRGGKEPLTPLYRLEYTFSERVSAVSVQVLSDVPQSYILNLTIRFTLWEVATDRVVFQGTSFASASYTFSNQRHANARASIDAHHRAAKVIAGGVRTHLAAFLAN